MSTLQIRDVPDDVKRVLKMRAIETGQNLSEYALAELRRSTERPTLAELTARIQARSAPRDPLVPSAAEILRAERDSC